MISDKNNWVIIGIQEWMMAIYLFTSLASIVISFVLIWIYFPLFLSIVLSLIYITALFAATYLFFTLGKSR